MADARAHPKTVLIAVFLLGISAIYALVVEVWSVPVLFVDSLGRQTVILLVAGIVGYYAIYAWLIYQTWNGTNVARLAVLVLIVTGIAVHASLALGEAGMLFGPIFVTVFLDSLRVVAAILLMVSPRTFWH